MNTVETPSTKAFWQEDSFSFIKPEEFDSLGIDIDDIPPGTVPARKHPAQLKSRFGGNAYGFGFYELYDRLSSQEAELLQPVSSENTEQIKRHYKQINRIYYRIGLLKRYSRLGKYFFLIPVHLAFSSLSRMKNKADEITKIIAFHRKKYMQENHQIGLITHAEDFLVNDLSLRFKEHRFIVLDSFEKLNSWPEPLDMIILPRDLNQILLMEHFIPHQEDRPSARVLDEYAFYLIGKIYRLLKPEGELFMIADHYTPKTKENIRVTFTTPQEERNFVLFSHVFKTQKSYQARGKPMQINRIDFQTYLNTPYVEKEVLDRLLGDKKIDHLKPKDLNELPSLMFPLENDPAYDQKTTWSKLLNGFFKQTFLKPLLPASIKTDWDKKFSIGGYTPDYMLIYLGQKKPLKATLVDLKKDVVESQLAGCSLGLLADYRDSFDYAIRTLEVLKRMKNDSYAGLSNFFIGRLQEPLQNKKRRHPALNAILQLTAKIHRLADLRVSLNPGQIEGPRTSLLKNLETLSLFGFSYEELKELLLIILGHTAMDRILTGKMSEKSLKPISDLARTYDLPQALNLLRYCRLMSMAETVASRRSDLNQEALADLFELYEALVKTVTVPDLDWDQFLDEKFNPPDGVYRYMISKILKMKNRFQFLGHWTELPHKGFMEKEVLADYNEEKLEQIEDVLDLLRISRQLEEMHFKGDLFRTTVFYRKLIHMEFHGTGQLFELLPGGTAFLFLWMSVSLARHNVLNFNPVLADRSPEEIGSRIQKILTEAERIDIRHLDLDTLAKLSRQLYLHQSVMIPGTGFEFRVNVQTQAVEMDYIDLDQEILWIEALSLKFFGNELSVIPVDDLKDMGFLFAHLEHFYRNHQDLPTIYGAGQPWPDTQNKWYQKVFALREALKKNLLKVILKPENIYDDLYLLYRYSPALLNFILPEFMALKSANLPEKRFRKFHLIEHILMSTKKIQALIQKDRTRFRDIHFLYKMAQREFGPTDTGIIGLSDTQIATLETITEELGRNEPLFNALIRSFILRDIGLIHEYKAKYIDRIHPADHAQAGVFILQQEQTLDHYELDPKARDYLIALVRHHNLIHHMIRGEYSFYAIQEVIDYRDKNLFDAFFLASFITFYAFGDEQILEDLAVQLFQLRALCHRIIDGETTSEKYLTEVYVHNGQLFEAYEDYQHTGLPDGLIPAQYFESYLREHPPNGGTVAEGRLIYAMERLLRLRGIRYVAFADLVQYLVKVPIKFIYQKKHLYDIGFATYEKEIYEAQRVFRSLQLLPSQIRNFILQHLVTDEIRIFGFENVSAYLNYENTIKLLLMALIGMRTLSGCPGPVGLHFSGLFDVIEKRYEAVNAFMQDIPAETLWYDHSKVDQCFTAKTGIVLKKDETHRVLSIYFIDQIDLPQKLAKIRQITEVDPLKNYYETSLDTVRKLPYHTDDYEEDLQKAFNDRLLQITDQMLDQTLQEIEQVTEFEELQRRFLELKSCLGETGPSDEQKHRLNDIFELRKDSLKQEKLESIERFFSALNDPSELKEYWNGLKWYLQHNRPYTGKEFENRVARKFDEKMKTIKAS